MDWRDEQRAKDEKAQKEEKRSDRWWRIFEVVFMFLVGALFVWVTGSSK